MKVFLPNEKAGFSLYAEGNLFYNNKEDRILTLSNSHILVLYYTYKNHRRLYMVCGKGIRLTQ